MLKWLNERSIEMATKIQSLYTESIRPKLESERGDTNFISILIILGIVIILAGVFIGFKDTIVAQVQAIIDGFVIE